MRQQVHGQRRHGDVRLAAHGARLAAARLHAAVRLPVARQIGRRGVATAALAALEARPLATAAVTGRRGVRAAGRIVRTVGAVRVRGAVGHGRRQRWI